MSVTKSHRTVDDAIVCISELILLCASGGFPVSNFACNNWVVLESVPEPLRAAGVRSIDFDQVCLQKILGVAWAPVTDNFVVLMQPVAGR